jgi:hypothetical protein
MRRILVKELMVMLPVLIANVAYAGSASLTAMHTNHLIDCFRVQPTDRQLHSFYSKFLLCLLVDLHFDTFRMGSVCPGGR